MTQEPLGRTWVWDMLWNQAALGFPCWSVMGKGLSPGAKPQLGDGYTCLGVLLVPDRAGLLGALG